MRTYQEVWNEYNNLFDKGQHPGWCLPAAYDRPRLIALCEELQAILAGGYGEQWWGHTAELHRQHKEAKIWHEARQ